MHTYLFKFVNMKEIFNVSRSSYFNVHVACEKIKRQCLKTSKFYFVIALKI